MRVKMNKISRRARSDNSGASVMEFGLIAPVVVFMMLGTMDIGHSYYVRATIDGAMQNAARSSSLEGSASVEAQQLVDARAKASVLMLAPGATVTSTRRYYKTFSEASAARAETIIEATATTNGRCDLGEKFVDANRNGVWDSDGGSDGQGGAKDVVLVKYKVRYPRLFPMAPMFGWPADVEIDSHSILANQPYGEQSSAGAAIQVDCPTG